MRVLQSGPAPKISIDVLDRKILFALGQNCRLPYTQVAKLAGLSRDAVRYRIQRLTSAGMIKGYRTIVDITKLGFLNVHIFLQLNQPHPDAEKLLVEKFKHYTFARAIIKFSGKYDFELAIIARDLAELDTIVSQVITDCGDYLQDYTTLFITGSFAGKTFPDNFLKPATEQKQQSTVPVVPDAIDHQLLKVIADNADLPLHHIARELGVSADTVKYRMKHLKEAGIIRGFVPVINYDVIGYHVYAILLAINGLTKKQEATLREFLATNKDVLWGVKAIGKYNVVLYICTNNPDDLIKTTAELRSHFTHAVRDYETLINYEEYKYTYLPPRAVQ